MPNFSGIWDLGAATRAIGAQNWPGHFPPQLALVAGFYSNGASVDALNLTSAGNATNFGDLTVGRYFTCGAGSNTRFICVSGNVSGTTVNTIDYTTYATTGTFSDFGDTNVLYGQGNNSPVSNKTRSCFTLSKSNEANDAGYNNISYVTNASTGNATDFGDTSLARYSVGGLSSTTRGVFAGGVDYTGSFVFYNVMDYITISSTGNATDFGDLTSTRNQVGGCASATRGLFCGGGNENTIDYITIASTGNATDFGDMPFGAYSNVAMATETKAVITAGSKNNSISQVTFTTTGNATDFGDLTRTRNRACGGSSSAASVQPT